MSKFGRCRLCPKNAPEKRLYADGVCAYHLNTPGDDLSAFKMELEALPSHEKRLLNQFYAEQSRNRPPYCENRCGTRLMAKDTWKLKAMVCHIVPKRLFPSVMLHPANRWFGCLECHHNYDDQGWVYAVTMKVWPVCLERFQQFMHMIKETEQLHLPAPFRDLINPIM